MIVVTRSLSLAAILGASVLVGIGEAGPSSHIDVSVQNGNWTYSVYNDSAQGSSQQIASFLVCIGAPVTVVGTPAGWNVQTDYASYVLWFNADTAPPFVNDISPGASLTGFVLQSAVGASFAANYEVASWDRGLNQPSGTASNTVASPCCDLIGSGGKTNVTDVQQIINESLGTVVGVHDLNQDGVVQIVDVQIVINALLGVS